MITDVLNKLRAIRENLGYTQDFVAIKLGMSGTNYSKIERGEVPVTLVDLIGIAEILNMNLMVGFEDKDKAHEPAALQEDSTDYITRVIQHIDQSTLQILAEIRKNK